MVIKNAKNLKAPGFDGLTMKFYWLSDSWQFFKLQDNPKAFSKINKTNIVLIISKSQGANEVTNFRSISPENSIVKTFFKLLANKLSVFIPDLIDNKQ